MTERTYAVHLTAQQIDFINGLLYQGNVALGGSASDELVALGEATSGLIYPEED